MSWPWLEKVILKSKKSPRRRCADYRPTFEFLETRTVPSFFTSPSFAVGSAPAAQAEGDFNGDGKADLAVVNEGSNTVSVLLGNGNGTFQAKTDYPTGTFPMGVAVGDFNGDGHLDIAVANTGPNNISILLGNGDGTFQPKTDIALLLTPKALTVGDFNGDGKADIAAATGNATTDDMTLLLGNGNGTFQVPVTTVTDTAVAGIYPGRVSSISTADFNGDGHLDLVVVNNKDGDLFGFRGGITGRNPMPGSASVLLGNGGGTFQAPQNFTVGLSPASVAVGDFNGDGRPDFAVSNESAGSVSVFTNAGGGNFSSSLLSLGSGNVSPGILAAGDFNGDGATDLAVPATVLPPSGGVFFSVTVLNGQTGVGLQAGATYALPLAAPVVGDFNGDGHLDIAGVGGNTFVGTQDSIEPWLNNGNGTFPAPVLMPAPGVTMSSQATADFNGEGIPDLVTASGQLELGLGDGHFGDTTMLQFPTGSSVAAVDADGNGSMDILVGNAAYPTGQVAAWLNTPGFDNRTGGAVGFTISSPAQVAAGANTSVTVTAADALGNPLPGFLGTVDLDFTPAGSTALNLVSQYTFTAADNGRHTFLFSNLTQVGAGNLAVFATGMPTKTAPVTVVPGALSQFVFSAPAAIPAGTPFSFTITAEDKFGNVETGYAGTVHFSALANDAQAVLPADYTFTAADGGTHTFTATLTRTAGATSPFIAATDVAAGASTSAKIVVSPLAAVNLSMNVASTTPTGIPLSVVVSAVDRFGNAANGYAGTVHFASSDPQAVLPADYSFTAADAGTHTFTPTLKTAGTQTLSVTDTANPAFSSQAQISAITVVPASFEFFEVPTTTAGAAYSFVVVALEASGSLATGYTGTVHLSSSDAQAALPADYAFTAADGGIHTFTVTLKTAGTQSISVADTAHPLLINSLSVTVAPGAVNHFVISGPTSVTQGVGFKITVTAEDAFGNVVPSYRGTVHLSSTDPTGGTQNFTFSSNDNGVHTFSYTFNALGFETLTIMDSTDNSIFGSMFVDVLAKSAGGAGGGGGGGGGGAA
jgi:FG-GAP-like repeat